MYINITNLVNVADLISGSTAAEQTAMTRLNDLINSHSNMPVLATGVSLPTASLENFGKVYYDTDSGNIVISNGKNWVELTTEVWSRIVYFGGSNYGFTAGGWAPGDSNVIDRFPFAADANATDFGDITTATYNITGVSNKPGSKGYLITSYTNVVDFTNSNSATNVTNLSPVSSYTGWGPSGIGNDTTGYFADTNIVRKFLFSNDTSVSPVVTMSAGNSNLAYMDAGANIGFWGSTEKLDKVNLNTETYTAVHPASPNEYLWNGSSASSATHGYQQGGYGSPTKPLHIDDIMKFPFASGYALAFVGNLSSGVRFSAGQSSEENGYRSGATDSPDSVIDKYPFSSDTNATNIGSLTQARGQTGPMFY